MTTLDPAAAGHPAVTAAGRFKAVPTRTPPPAPAPGAAASPGAAGPAGLVRPGAVISTGRPWTTGRHRTGTGPPGRTRLTGVDAARGLAVLGMIVVHVATADASAGLWQLVNGRAAVLFGLLGGVSLALLVAPVLGSDDSGVRSRLRRRVAVRALLLVGLGLVLAAVSTGPMVILVVYGVEFLLVLPLLFARPVVLAMIAAVWAVAGPLLSFALRSVLPGPRNDAGQLLLGNVMHASDLTSAAGLVRALDTVLLSGAYPVLTWMPFLLLGMAIGRLDLRACAGRLLAGGLAGATIGYGGSWLAMDVLGGRQALLRAVEPMSAVLGMPPAGVLEIVGAGSYGTVPTTTPTWLLTAIPHSGSPFDVVGASGIAVAVLALCLLAARALGGLLEPLAATGALALTLYTGHIVALALVGDTPQTTPWATTAAFCAVAVLLATGWRGLVGRGPLESLVHSVSTRAAGAR
ncbi:heparan-alpha-glucosaminide N-acetyltransferase domain-containing protein [Pseudonocardia parietis]|uniref:Membrane protein YeiB n=1 Tax=Pseudonocardia parietis TaxID=570936 RepID=A0ABS4W003_9PSEU|nr:heparan-alpha-glucosaminide N-acetyltransferase domain-containing protein [Pseudonocardia parietis]MBP2369501.1 putative membrane protein YeiB [Pseudonocardia parietis]